MNYSLKMITMAAVCDALIYLEMKRKEARKAQLEKSVASYNAGHWSVMTIASRTYTCHLFPET
jgi:hypothetical protein